METNLRALRSRAPSSESLSRYSELGPLLTGQAQATADDAVRWIHELVTALHIPRLNSYGITSADISTLVEASSKASSMKSNPLALTPEELAGIVQRAL
jgi:alcohol dehydrogenase class IV